MHGTARDVLLSLRVLRHEGRQDYLLGRITPGRSIEDFVKYLETQQLKNHFIALMDDDEVVSVRKLVDFEHQYHLRIFEDGEVRGHYEYTPESHPRLHMKKVGQEARREDFLRFLGDWIVPAPANSTRVPAGKPSSVTRIIGRKPF
jgi:hypothetical protein